MVLKRRLEAEDRPPGRTPSRHRLPRANPLIVRGRRHWEGSCWALTPVHGLRLSLSGHGTPGRATSPRPGGLSGDPNAHIRSPVHPETLCRTQSTSFSICTEHAPALHSPQGRGAQSGVHVAEASDSVTVRAD